MPSVPRASPDPAPRSSDWLVRSSFQSAMVGAGMADQTLEGPPTRMPANCRLPTRKIY
jgi:hypothetical protein